MCDQTLDTLFSATARYCTYSAHPPGRTDLVVLRCTCWTGLDADYSYMNIIDCVINKVVGHLALHTSPPDAVASYPPNYSMPHGDVEAPGRES